MRLQGCDPCCAGIGYSDDKLLQTRIFSYADTQRHRLGPNYLLLPVNAPKCPHHNNHHDGFMNFMHRDEEVGCLVCTPVPSPGCMLEPPTCPRGDCAERFADCFSIQWGRCKVLFLPACSMLILYC